jgi:4-aminobutyrate aminotransferase
MNEKYPFDHVSPVWFRYSDMVVSHGAGSYLYDTEGNKYLDFTTGIGVTNTGHCHPKVVKAIQEQAEKLIHGQANIVMHQPMLDLIDRLKKIVHPSLDGFFFSNSGAEAVEGAVKLARMATGRPNVIVFQGSFHGRTVGTMSLTTSKTIYRAGYQPLMPGVFVAPFPYVYRYGWDEEQTSRWCLDELELLLMSQTAPHETAAILIEPVLGEGGYVVPPRSFIEGLREIADQHGILLIFDEIQSGFGRTGKWFAHDHFDVRPDIITVAKSLASGMPISGVISRLELMEKWIPGSHGGTYGGNVVAAAAAVATFDAIEEENMLENAAEKGEQLINALKEFQRSHPEIGDVRGLGLMIGVEYRDGEGKPSKELAKAVTKKAFEKGLILLTCGPWDNTIRLIPPINISSTEVEEALGIIEDSL